MKRFEAGEIAQWCKGTWDPAPPACTITGFSKDSRTVAEGQVYVALIGDSHDGHRFVADAAGAGAAAAVVSMGYDGRCSLPLLRVEDTLQAVQSIAACYRTKIDPFVIGVSGSSGKTTAKEMIAGCLGKRFSTACTPGNWNNHIGLPFSLLDMDETVQCAVMELGMNHPGELEPLCRILRPEWSVLTNVGPVHLEHFGSVRAIAEEKAVLLARTSSSGLVFLDADGAYFSLLSGYAPCPVVTVSAFKEADYVYHDMGDCRFSIAERSTGETCEIKLGIPGLHIMYDAALAASVARQKGLDWNEIVSGLEGYKPLPMRWETSSRGDVCIINDAYNANPMSMRASINAFCSQPCSGRRWLVLGDMLELGGTAEHEHRQLGCWLAGKGVYGLVCVGSFASAVAGGASGLVQRVVAVNTSGEVADCVAGFLQPGDSVLVKGSRGVRLEYAAAAIESFLSGGGINTK